MSNRGRQYAKGSSKARSKTGENMKTFSKVSAFALAISVSQVSFADPFTACPTDAFLIQDKLATLYGVQLATGQYQLLSNTMGTTNKLNALAFNFHDQYLYAWSSEYSEPVRIDDTYQVTPLSTSGLPDTSFYVGKSQIHV